ncbi:MAG TPA: outer membrane lipoprotein-sorting protein [Vicinamibacterales bacterium]|nr:outer membrane lipoprotein-sorting protein [Vicinamibacterales bacterium]
MRKHWLLMSIVAVLTVCRAAVAYAQTVDEIVEKYLAASGGRAAFEKLTSRVVTGTISVSTPAGELSGTIEVYNKGPLKQRTLVKIDAAQLGIGQIVQDQRFNGTSGYAIDSINGNREMTGDQLATARNNSFPSPLLNYKENGTKIELLGREKVGDKDAYVLQMSPKTGPAGRLFIDVDTNLIVKTVVTVDAPPVGTIEQTLTMSDYRDVDGVKVPYKIRSSNQFQDVSITVTKVVQNSPIDDQMFSKPE